MPPTNKPGVRELGGRAGGSGRGRACDAVAAVEIELGLAQLPRGIAPSAAQAHHGVRSRSACGGVGETPPHLVPVNPPRSPSQG